MSSQSSSSANNEFFYANGYNELILGFTLDTSTGLLTGPMAMPGPLTTFASSATLAVSPSSKYLFAYDTQNEKVAAFSIDNSSGALTAIPGSPFALGVSGSPGGLAADPAGNFLYVADFSGILGFSISSTGALSALSGSPFSDSNSPFGLAITPSGTFLYASEGYSISGFAINPTSASLSPIPGSPFPTLIYQTSYVTAVHPSGHFLFSSSGDGIISWSIDSATGALTMVSGSPFSAFAYNPQFPITGMAVDPAGKFLYACSNQVPATIAEFSIDSNTGSLIPLSSSPFSVSLVPQELIVDPSGQFLLAASPLEVSEFRIDSSGSLSFVNTLSLTAQTQLASPSTFVAVKGQ